MKRSVSAILLGAALSGVSPAPAEDRPAADSLESTRAIVARWVETQGVISRETKDWAQAREMLTARIDMLTKEIATAEEKLGEAGDQRREAVKTRGEIESEAAGLKAITEHLGGQVQDLESRVRGLVRFVPESMQEKLSPLMQRIPENPASAKVSVAERFQNVLGILNELNRIQSEISVVTEIRPLSDGKPSEVKTVYVGLAQAYYVSARGEAGTGKPGEAGWTWTADDRLARDVNEVLEILQNKSSPRFVPLPVEVK
jgi:hypothetical protein